MKMISKVVILACVLALAVSAPKELNDGELVAVALEKYAEYMVVPENQNKLLHVAKSEELKAADELNTPDDHAFREVEGDVAANEETKVDSVFESLLNEMGSAKNIIVGLPLLLEAIDKCKHTLEDDDNDSIRKKRDLIEWFKKTYENFKNKTEGVRSFLKSDVKDFIKHNVTKFITEDVPEFFEDDVANFFRKDVKDFFSNDVKKFIIENYEKAKKLLGLTSEDGKSTFQERMDDFLSTTRKGLKKAGKFGYCMISTNLDNPLLKTIVDIFV